MISGYDFFKFCENIGLPLEDILFEITRNNVVVDWPDYTQTALENN